MVKSIHESSILIVDDNPTNLKILFTLLNQAGFRVSVAKSGESALLKVEEALPDLILLDVMMPGIDGFETCCLLKANLKTQEIPIIFLSALDEVIDKVKAFSVGAVDYITKPFQTEEVLVRVKNQLTLCMAKAEVSQLNVELEQRILQRTAQLEVANQELEQEISERQQAQESLLKSEEQFRLTFESAPIGMAIQTLDGRFVRVNQALCETLNYTKPELLHKTWADLTHPDDLAVSHTLSQHLAQEICDFQAENRFLAKDGRVVYGILQVALVQDSRGKPLHFISQFMDITNRKQAQEQLIYSALHDALTNLPNRTLLTERLEIALKRAKRHADYLFAVLFIDLDRFKVINDNFGHQVGDQLLVAMARKLETIVRSTDTVTRLGGDEFIILLDPIQSINDAIQIAERISEELNSPFQLEASRLVFTTASIGIALGSTNHKLGTELLQNADLAMYRAKEKGKARFEVFDQAIYAQALKQLQLENDLRQALQRHEFQVYYQPIVSLNTGMITGFEALIRWQHPERGLVSPAEFIPVAEETGLIVSIGDWVLREACRQLRRWQLQFLSYPILSISVNISGKQFSEGDLIEQISQILQETNLDAHNLKLELTESILLENAESAVAILRELKAMNIQLYMDDFGTGYSSLSYLHHFPIDLLKIDRSFISTMELDNKTSAIIQAIATLAHNLSMELIAEGIETEAQLTKLRKMGCEYGQGYFFSKPVNSEAAGALIAKRLNWLSPCETEVFVEIDYQ